MGGLVPSPVESGHRNRVAATRRNGEERTIRAGREEDHAVSIPGAAARRPHVAENFRVAAGDRDLLSLPTEKNASDRLSGDQKGCVAPLVPGKARVLKESMAATHRGLAVPAESVSTIASIRPFGEIAHSQGIRAQLEWRRRRDLEMSRDECRRDG